MQNVRHRGENVHLHRVIQGARELVRKGADWPTGGPSASLQLWMAEFARRTIGTEPNEVTFAHLLLAVTFFAARTVFTKALGVGGAIFGSGLLVHVQEDAIVSIVAFSIVRPKVTRRHLTQLITMQELTIAVLLTQRIQPMLAHRRFRLYMQIRTLKVRTLTFCVMTTYLTYPMNNTVSQPNVTQARKEKRKCGHQRERKKMRRTLLLRGAKVIVCIVKLSKLHFESKSPLF